MPVPNNKIPDFRLRISSQQTTKLSLRTLRFEKVQSIIWPGSIYPILKTPGFRSRMLLSRQPNVVSGHYVLNKFKV